MMNSILQSENWGMKYSLNNWEEKYREWLEDMYDIIYSEFGEDIVTYDEFVRFMYKSSSKYIERY